jgi:arsenate reductase (thioredoxin)
MEGDVKSPRIPLLVTIIAAAALPAGLRAEKQNENAPTTTPTVLFVCQHGAAKSVLASAYFERLAMERGLNVRVESAGTDPDAQVSPVVARHLATNGYPVPVATPRRVAAADFELADVVVSLGCDMKYLPRGRLLRWDDVPSPSRDFARADEAILKRVVELVEELIRTQRVPK